MPKVNWPDLQNRWPHLADLPLVKTGGKVDILLGLNHANLMIPRELREGAYPEQPYAIKTKLGWIVRGVVSPGRSQKTNINLIRQEYQQLDLAFRKFITSEDFGTECADIVRKFSEDQRATDIISEGT